MILSKLIIQAMTKVLYTAFDIVPSPKGASTHILHNIRGLVNSHFDVHLLTPNDGLLPSEDTVEGARVTRIPQDLTQNFLERAAHFGRAVLNHLALHHEYRVVHYRNIWDGLGIAQNKKRLGYKTLFEVNGLPSIELKYHYPGLDLNLLSKIKEQEIATLHLSDAIVCPSNVTRAYIASLGLNRKLVTVIPNGVSPSDFSPSPPPNREGRVPVLLYIGTLADWQGLEVVIKALPRILENQPVRLQIVGRGRSRQRKVARKANSQIGHRRTRHYSACRSTSRSSSVDRECGHLPCSPWLERPQCDAGCLPDQGVGIYGVITSYDRFEHADRARTRPRGCGRAALFPERPRRPGASGIGFIE
jgi:glycosyltransferase involved in cell wall biosynthesis